MSGVEIKVIKSLDLFLTFLMVTQLLRWLFALYTHMYTYTGLGSNEKLVFPREAWELVVNRWMGNECKLGWDTSRYDTPKCIVSIFF